LGSFSWDKSCTQPAFHENKKPSKRQHGAPHVAMKPSNITTSDIMES
jgi:hypothetical protein